MRSILSGAAPVCLFVCLLVFALTATAQERPNDRRELAPPGASASSASAASGQHGSVGERPPDLSITANVTAESLIFRRVPEPRVEFTGRPRRETLWEAERTNLPEEVRPGVTYRDLGIRLRIISVFADIERIVAEALGEVPTSEEFAPEPAPEPTPVPGLQPQAQARAETAPRDGAGRARAGVSPHRRNTQRGGAGQ